MQPERGGAGMQTHAGMALVSNRHTIYSVLKYKIENNNFINNALALGKLFSFSCIPFLGGS